MFNTLSNPSAAYRQIGLDVKTETASPHELVVMLFDGALVSIASAIHHMQAGDIPSKGAAISKAIDIVESGLKASLDHRAGGDIADRLGALYEYMSNRLLYANLHNNQAALEEVAGLLRDIRGAWEEIGKDAAVSTTKAAA